MREPGGFGRLLRQLRRSRDLTQDALAQRSGCVADMVKKIEGGQRRPSRQLAVLFADALGLSGTERAGFLEAARQPTPRDARVDDQRPAPPVLRLPQPPSPLVGRAWELANLCTLLTQGAARLVTLIGPGGTGKTRLALAAAHTCSEQFADRAVFVGLASIATPEEVAPAIAQALGLRAVRGVPLVDQLADYLASKHLLLVLDNVEHVLPAVPLVGALLAAAQRLVILATSRAPLRLAGEQEFSVSPLAVPSSDLLPPLERIRQYPAVALFVARAQAIRQDFALDDATAPLVVAICRQLDGLPLAIELAVVRLRLFTLLELRDQLAQPLRLLTSGPRDAPARQQTLSATIDWSFRLLRPAEQHCFARLAVFVGGCALDAAAAVCADAPSEEIQPGNHASAAGHTLSAAIDHLSALRDQSLIQHEEPVAGQGRLTMLETVRAYALERLIAAGEHAAVRERHAQAYLRLAEAALAHLYGPEQARWLQRLDGERGNLHAALSWWRAERPTLGLQLAAALWPFWELRGHFGEGRAWLEELLPLACDAPAPVRAWALHGIGHFASFQSDYATAERALQASLELYTELGQPARAAHVRCALGLLAWFRGDHLRAESELQASADQARAAGATWETADALHYLGHVVIDRGDSTRAEAIFQESLTLFQRTGDQRNIALPLKDLGLLASQRGDDATALPLYHASLASSRAIEDTWHIADTLLRLGDLKRRDGDWEAARALYLEALSGWERMGARGGVAETRTLLGHVALEQRDLPRARAYYQEVITFQQTIGSARVLAGLHFSLGQVAWYEGDLLSAEAAYREGLDLNVKDDYRPGIGDCLVGLAEIAVSYGQTARAARLLGAAEALRALPRGFMPLADQTGAERTASTVAALLTPEQLATHTAAGRVLSLEAAVAYARRPTSEDTPPGYATVPASDPDQMTLRQVSGLTAREAEVLLLVARGLTDQQVAAQLVVSPRTVQSHLRTIYDKLGCTSRTAAAHIAHTLLIGT